MLNAGYRKSTTRLSVLVSRKMKKGVTRMKRKIKGNKKTREFISCTLSLQWLRFGSELQPWLSKTEALTIWISVGSVSFLFVIPQYPHYPVGVRDRCHASRTFGGRTVGISMTHWALRRYTLSPRPPHLYLHHWSIGFEVCRSWHTLRVLRIFYFINISSKLVAKQDYFIPLTVF